MTSLAEERLILEKHLAVERARKGMLAFTLHTKPDYEVNWHHRIIARHLNAVADGRIKRLIVCMPPRCGKTELVSIRFPAYLLGRNPDAQIISASYNATLASKVNRSVQRVIESPEFKETFPDTQLAGARPVDGQSYVRRNDEFEVVGHRGFYRSTSVGGSATGYGMSIGILDDFVKNREEANSPTYQERNWDWYTSTFYSRLEKGGSIIICVTRWSQNDIISRLLDQAKAGGHADQWTLLNFPAINDTADNPHDPRAIGEPLWAGKYPLSELERIKATIGSRDWASLYQQRPAPQEGSIIKQSWWQFYERLPTDLTNWLISVDLAFKGKKGESDYCCFQVWACRGADRYLVDMVMDRMEFTEQLRAFKQLCAKWPQCRTKIIEDAANGAALISLCKREIQGVIAVTAKGSKESRLEAVAPQIEAGNVWLPRPTAKPWVNDVMMQVQYLGSGAHDDAVDALSHGLMRLTPKAYDITAGMPITVGDRSHLAQNIR